jgi:DNA-binding CsgD family transcriptional regulator
MGSVAQTLVAQGPPTMMRAGVAASNGRGPLADTARPVVDALASDLAGMGIGVVLSDVGGNEVDRRVPEPWLDVHPGFPEVTGPATPIMDPGTGRPIGQLALICGRADASRLIRPLAALAVREIQQRLVDDEAVAERLALGRFLKKRRGAKGPFGLVTERRFIPNAAADRLVGPDEEPVLRAAANRLSDRLREVTTIVLSGRPVVVRAVPVPDDEPPGIILQLKPLDADTDHAGRRRERTGGWASLTDTERSVVDVVAEGLTNREAAERLFLSPHTVDFHLRSIYRKLGTGSRVQLTRLVILAQHTAPTSGQSAGDGDGHAQRRSLAGRARELQVSADRLHAVAQPHEP